MKIKPALIFTTLLILAMCFEVRTQSSAVENEQCNEEFALLLVSQQVSEGRNITETAKKVRILTRSGDFIWSYDQPTARLYLAEAFKTAFDHYREKGIESQKVGTQAGSVSTRLPDYRFEVLTTIAKRDQAWARKLVEEIMADFEKNAKNRKFGQELAELQYLLSMAVEFADINKDLSWWVFRKVMEHPLDQHWYFTLSSLSGKDDQMAMTLYTELLARYRNASPRRMLFLSAYPFRSDRTLGIDKFSYGTRGPDGLEPLPQLQQQFLDVFFNRIAAYAANPQERMQAPEPNRRPEPVYMMSALLDIEQTIINELPHLLQRFANAKAQTESMLSEEMRKTLETRDSQNQRAAMSFEERYAQLEKEDEEGKLTDGMIINMIFAARLTEEQFQMMEPWMDKIKEENVRKETTNYFWFQRSSSAIKDERFTDGEKYAAKVPEIEHRAILAFELAEAQLKKQSDAAGAYQTLNEVSKLVRTMENSAAKAKILFGIANNYLELNPGFAMEELAEAVRVINRTKDPDMNSGSVFRQIIGKQGSWFAVFSLPGYRIENTFEKMGEQEFGLTLSNARAIEDKYLKTIAVIATAKNCIGKKKPATTEATGH